MLAHGTQLDDRVSLFEVQCVPAGCDVVEFMLEFARRRATRGSEVSLGDMRSIAKHCGALRSMGSVVTCGDAWGGLDAKI